MVLAGGASYIGSQLAKVLFRDGSSNLRACLLGRVRSHRRCRFLHVKQLSPSGLEEWDDGVADCD